LPNFYSLGRFHSKNKAKNKFNPLEANNHPHISADKDEFHAYCSARDKQITVKSMGTKAAVKQHTEARSHIEAAKGSLAIPKFATRETWLFSFPWQKTLYLKALTFGCYFNG
jgi:hypothetical protein